jgi:hypothetical protein
MSQFCGALQLGVLHPGSAASTDTSLDRGVFDQASTLALFLIPKASGRTIHETPIPKPLSIHAISQYSTPQRLGTWAEEDGRSPYDRFCPRVRKNRQHIVVDLVTIARRAFPVGQPRLRLRFFVVQLKASRLHKAMNGAAVTDQYREGRKDQPTPPILMMQLLWSDEVSRVLSPPPATRSRNVPKRRDPKRLGDVLGSRSPTLTSRRPR